jgi:hypothetical protein
MRRFPRVERDRGHGVRARFCVAADVSDEWSLLLVTPVPKQVAREARESDSKPDRGERGECNDCDGTLLQASVALLGGCIG